MARLFQNTLYISIAHGWQMAMAIVLIPFATRYLGDEGFGKYSLATTIMYFVFLFNDFGLNTLATREIARTKHKTQAFFGEVLGLKLLLILSSLIFVVLFSLFANYDKETYLVVWIFAVCGILGSFTQLGYAVFRAHERMELQTFIAVLEKTISTFLSILVLIAGYTLIAFSNMFLFASVVAIILSMLIISRKFVSISAKFDWHRFKPLITSAFAFGFSMFLATIYNQVDIVMLSMMKNMDAVGWYGAAYKLLSFTNLVPTVFATAFFPRMSMSMDNREEISKIFSVGIKYLLLLAIPLVPGVFILAEKITILVFGNEFINSSMAIRILVFASGILFINIFLAGLYGATNHQIKIVIIQIIGLIVNVVSNALLIPKYSYIGASITTIITEGLVIILALSWAIKNICVIREFSFLPKALFATTIMSIFLLIFNNLHIILTILIAVAIYSILIILLGAVNLRQLKQNF